jgi:hypothetical protein
LFLSREKAAPTQLSSDDDGTFGSVDLLPKLHLGSQGINYAPHALGLI